ncbi:MAG: hypothetical protein K2K84_02445, partial [Muribaculaceae bacterium]|nr:hypothetical protein [Muribaculaceae bacterium]
MKRTIFFVLICLVCIGFFAEAKRGSITDNKEDLANLEAAIALYDEGDYEAALVEMDNLLKKYPNDYYVTYE